MPEKSQCQPSLSSEGLITLPSLTAMTQDQLGTWVAEAQTYTHRGQLPGYIPRLAQANPAWFAVQVQAVDQVYACGDITRPFPLMSVVKPFVLLYLLEQLGSEAVFERVGMAPSDQPFDSLTQLEADQGWPRNPMINSGAIVLASLLPGNNGPACCDRLRQWLNHQAGCQLFLDQLMLASVRSVSSTRNQMIASLLTQFGQLDAAETALDTYNHICCLTGTVTDLAKLGLLLAQPGPILAVHRRTVNAIMTTCGLYQMSGHFAARLGLPTKSGVSGALLSVVPGEGAIACYSPALDSAGNSLAGLFLLQQLAQALDLSVFS